MRTGFLISLFLLLNTNVQGAGLTAFRPTEVGRDKKVYIIADFDDSIKTDATPLKYSLVTPGGDRIHCDHVLFKNKRARFIFQLNSLTFVAFEKLVVSSAGYYLSNDERIEFGEDALNEGDLEEQTLDKIPTIDEEKWKKYIVDEYAAQYLFPHSFQVGTQLGIEDSTKTVYFLGLSESQMWSSAGAFKMFWAIKGRWSTDRDDKLNYIQLYPLTALVNLAVGRLAFLSGVETGYRGFAREGRGNVKAVMQIRVPYNPIDLTLGSPRGRLNPVLTVGFLGNLGWSDIQVSNEKKRSAEAFLTVRYDIPVADTYYLQSEVTGEYSSETHELQYRYDISLGYIADGNIRIMAQFKQGHQVVSHVFDKQLLLGFALDVLNQTATR